MNDDIKYRESECILSRIHCNNIPTCCASGHVCNFQYPISILPMLNVELPCRTKPDVALLCPLHPENYSNVSSFQYSRAPSLHPSHFLRPFGQTEFLSLQNKLLAPGSFLQTVWLENSDKRGVFGCCARLICFSCSDGTEIRVGTA